MLLCCRVWLDEILSPLSDLSAKADVLKHHCWGKHRTEWPLLILVCYSCHASFGLSPSLLANTVLPLWDWIQRSWLLTHSWVGFPFHTRIENCSTPARLSSKLLQWHFTQLNISMLIINKPTVTIFFYYCENFSLCPHIFGLQKPGHLRKKLAYGKRGNQLMLTILTGIETCKRGTKNLNKVPHAP